MDETVAEIRPGIYRLRGEGGSPHSYLVCGDARIALIDSGLTAHFGQLAAKLGTVGLAPEDVDLVINTHEHTDHIGANVFFEARALIAAHRLAATKMTLDDYWVTLHPARRPHRVHLWLENLTHLDLGGYALRVLHTPGHTSGAICLYEPHTRLLFSGDTVFAGGTLSLITESGSVADYVNSLERLMAFRIEEIHPGHGRASTTPAEDLARAVEGARSLLRDGGPAGEIFHEHS